MTYRVPRTLQKTGFLGYVKTEYFLLLTFYPVFAPNKQTSLTRRIISI
jgi:hypothetical protein